MKIWFDTLDQRRINRQIIVHVCIRAFLVHAYISQQSRKLYFALFHNARCWLLHSCWILSWRSRSRIWAISLKSHFFFCELADECAVLNFVCVFQNSYELAQAHVPAKIFFPVINLNGAVCVSNYYRDLGIECVFIIAYSQKCSKCGFLFSCLIYILCKCCVTYLLTDAQKYIVSTSINRT